VRLLDTRFKLLYEQLTAQSATTPRQFGVLLTLHAPDPRFELTRSGSLRRRDPISSCPSRFVEMFPELRRRCAAYDQSSVRVINADFIAAADFYFG
jgi:hypothetical protein